MFIIIIIVIIIILIIIRVLLFNKVEIWEPSTQQRSKLHFN
jgi:hypothetical protein